MEFKLDQIVWTCLLGAATVAGWVIANAISNFLSHLDATMNRLANSIEDLNIKMAVVIEQNKNLTFRVGILEQKVK